MVMVPSPGTPMLPTPTLACCLSASTTRQIIHKPAREKTTRLSLSRIWTTKCDKNWSLKNCKNASNKKCHKVEMRPEGFWPKRRVRELMSQGRENQEWAKQLLAGGKERLQPVEGDGGPRGAGPQHCQEHPPSRAGSGSSAHPSCIPGFLHHFYHTACVPTNSTPSQARGSGSLLCTPRSQTSTHKPQTGNQPFDKPFT